MNVITPYQIEMIEALYSLDVSRAEIARTLGIHRDTVRAYTKRIDAGERFGRQDVNTDRTGGNGEPVLEIPRQDEIIAHMEKHRLRFVASQQPTTTFIFTAAQNNTAIHEGFWNNLRAYADHLDAEILVGGFMYNKNALGQTGQEKTHDATEEKKLRWAPELDAYRSDTRREITPSLVWMGQMNAMPTNTDPLAGLTGYSRGSSAIYPHVKIALRSLDTAPEEDPKFLYTTGAVTMPNYIQRKAGQVAEFHHVIGALIVEVDPDGIWFARQINATDEGSFQDLDAVVKDRRVTRGNPIFALNWGDIHERKLEPEMREAGWGEGGILDETRPQYQVFHDLVDAESANPHDRGDYLRRYSLVVSGKDDITDELDEVADFLNDTARPTVISLVVPSNHDDMITRWLKATDPRTDPKNSRLWAEAHLAATTSIDNKEDVDLIKWYLEPKVPINVVFISPQKPTYKLKGIEFGIHGHIGSGGNRRPSDKSFALLAIKVNKGHTHKASIIDGVYTAGVQARLDHGYNVGYGGWSQSMIFTYPNGKRAIITMRKFRYKGASR